VSDSVNLLPLAGVLLVVIGFAARLNPALVVVGAGFATALLAGIEVVATCSNCSALPSSRTASSPCCC
jgi:uncharacterized membrane protein